MIKVIFSKRRSPWQDDQRNTEQFHDDCNSNNELLKVVILTQELILFVWHLEILLHDIYNYVVIRK
jgi:hypothetical protein